MLFYFLLRIKNKWLSDILSNIAQHLPLQQLLMLQATTWIYVVTNSLIAYN